MFHFIKPFSNQGAPFHINYIYKEDIVQKYLIRPHRDSCCSYMFLYIYIHKGIPFKKRRAKNADMLEHKNVMQHHLDTCSKDSQHIHTSKKVFLFNKRNWVHMHIHIHTHIYIYTLVYTYIHIYILLYCIYLFLSWYAWSVLVRAFEIRRCLIL